MKNLNNQRPDGDSPEWIEVVREHVTSLRFGFVQVTVHEGRVVQIEKTERLRLEKPQSEQHR